MALIVKKFVCLCCIVLPAHLLFAQPVTFTIQTDKKAQTIENFGASGAWFTEGIGKYWAAEKKERMAELLFSKKMDAAGNPLGIGLSAWRFNIGGGTAEQGDSSGIDNPVKRVECFLLPDGSFNWNKQQGYLWFTKKAIAYGVKDIIAFSNTPPVQFTKNGLGFKTEKDYQTNLSEDKYGDYAAFLATVLSHFEKQGIRFNYISPVNEPQWDWSAKFGHMNQEGSPWHNSDIFKITSSLDSALSEKKLAAKILIPEAGILSSLYEGGGHAAKQIQYFYDKESPFYAGRFRHLYRGIEGHSYFTDNGDTNIVTVRQHVKDTAARYKIAFWQSEYCMLGDGYREGTQGNIPAIDCALFLAKIIHHDLVVANASAWHFWNSWEPGAAEYDTRYYLLALNNNALNTDGDFTITKNLWALGNYSRFIRSGMQRVATARSDGLHDLQAAKEVMLAAFTGSNQIVVTAVNYTNQQKEITLLIPGAKKIKSASQYVTSAAADDNMKKYPVESLEYLILKPRSISTIVIDCNAAK